MPYGPNIISRFSQESFFYFAFPLPYPGTLVVFFVSLREYTADQSPAFRAKIRHNINLDVPPFTILCISKW